MAGFEMTEWIAGPPDQVFRYLTDPARVPDWMPGSRMVPATDGPLGVGTTLRETRTAMGREAETELTIRAFDPGRAYAVENVTSGVVTTYRYTFSPENGGTRVRLAAESTAGGLRRVSAALLSLVLRRQDRNHLKRLKSAMEAPAPVGG